MRVKTIDDFFYGRKIVITKSGRRPGRPCKIKEELPQDPKELLKKTLLKRITKKKETKCWEYRGALSNGYGVIGIERKQKLTHRVAYELFKNEAPGERLVLHSCDNRKCINPDHLFLGTNNDNQLDAILKGRTTRNFISKTIMDDQGNIYNGLSECANKTGLTVCEVSHIVNHIRLKNTLGLRYIDKHLYPDVKTLRVV